MRRDDWFAVALPATAGSAAVGPAAGETEPGSETTQNKPVGFVLKGIQSDHRYLRQRGISEETSRAFGVGFFSGRGSMSGRLVIPIHDSEERLVAYAGRSVDGVEPRYKLSSGFQKSLVLYNLHRAIKAPEKRCAVVVEGYFDAMKVHQAGFPCVVARDGDEAGQAAAGELLPRLARLLFVRVAPVPQDKQPDQLSSEEVRELLAM